MKFTNRNKSDLEISLEGNQLQIRGSREENDSNKIFIHRGIATRQFQRNFILAEGIEVEEASMDNGLLFIDLSQPISNEESKKIEIKDKNNKIKDNLYGNASLAFIKKEIHKEENFSTDVFSVYCADGTLLAAFDSKESAIAAILQSGLEHINLHYI